MHRDASAIVRLSSSMKSEAIISLLQARHSTPTARYRRPNNYMPRSWLMKRQSAYEGVLRATKAAQRDGAAAFAEQ